MLCVHFFAIGAVTRKVVHDSQVQVKSYVWADAALLAAELVAGTVARVPAVLERRQFHHPHAAQPAHSRAHRHVR